MEWNEFNYRSAQHKRCFCLCLSLWFFQSIVLWSLQRGKRTPLHSQKSPTEINWAKMGGDFWGPISSLSLSPSWGSSTFVAVTLVSQLIHHQSRFRLVKLQWVYYLSVTQIRSPETPVSKPLPAGSACLSADLSACPLSFSALSSLSLTEKCLIC